MRYQRAEDQEDQQVDPPDIENVVFLLEQFESNLFARVQQFKEEERIRLTLLARSQRFQVDRRFPRAVEGYELPGFENLTERLQFLANELPQVTVRAYGKIFEEVKGIKRGIDRGDHQAAVALYFEILNCVRRTEELIDGLIDASRLLTQIVPDSRQHE